MKGDVTLEEMRKIVKEFLKIYDADKTGIVDYALESAGILIKQKFFQITVKRS